MVRQCDCCSSHALIYQWDKWLCHKHWREERDRQEEKEQQYQQLIRRNNYGDNKFKSS
jgi:hypothetical protein